MVENTTQEFFNNARNVIKFCQFSRPSITDSDYWQMIHIPQNSQFLIIKKQAVPYFSRCIIHLRSILRKNDIEISESYLQQSLLNFFKHVLLNNDFNSEYKCLLLTLIHLRLQTFKFLLPINNYTYYKNIDLKYVKIVKITKDIIMHEFPNYDYNIMNVLQLCNVNKTNIFAIVTVTSLEKNHACDLAYEYANRFISVVKLLDPYSHAILRKNCAMPLCEITFLQNESNFECSSHNHNLNSGIFPNQHFQNFMNTYWEKFNMFLYNRNCNDLEKTILIGLYWYGISDIHTSTKLSIFINSIIGIENILIGHRTYNKSEYFSATCEKIFKIDKQFWKKCYEKRNEIVHQNLPSIYIRAYAYLIAP